MNRMRRALIAVMIMMLASVAFAAPEEVPLGAHKVGFDLNTMDNYTIRVYEPVVGIEFEIEPERNNTLSQYSFDIAFEDGSVISTSLIEWSRFMDATFIEGVMLQRFMYECYGYRNITGAYLDIDGKQGYLMTAVGGPTSIWGESTFSAWYWLDKVDLSNGVVSYGRNKVSISGNNVTSEVMGSFLGTVKVGR